jgi:hypothetical protein
VRWADAKAVQSDSQFEESREKKIVHVAYFISATVELKNCIISGLKIV